MMRTVQLINNFMVHPLIVALKYSQYTHCFPHALQAQESYGQDGVNRCETQLPAVICLSV